MRIETSNEIRIDAFASSRNDHRADESDSGPWIGCWKVEQTPRPLDGVALAVVARGELLVRFLGGDVVRLVEGDCLRLSLGVSCQLGGRDSRAELILFRADAAWAAAAVALAGGSNESGEPVAAVDRAGSERARGASRVLRNRLLPPRGQSHDLLRDTAASFELLTRALEPTPHEPDATQARRAGAQTRSAFQQAVDAWRESDLPDVRLESLARTLGRSERQVARMFQQQLGHNYREHRTQLRIERAKELLSTTALRVVEVAENTGWGSLAHFNQTFRRRVGMTPTAWRASSSCRDVTADE